MDLGYPAEPPCIPGILIPAACPTFMGFTFGIIGEPAKPPLDVIFPIHKWFEKSSEIRFQ